MHLVFRRAFREQRSRHLVQYRSQEPQRLWNRAAFYPQNIGQVRQYPSVQRCLLPRKAHSPPSRSKNKFKFPNAAKPAHFRISELGLKQQIMPARDSESPNLLIRKPASRLDAGTQAEQRL
jgi:hypothetical protein